MILLQSFISLLLVAQAPNPSNVNDPSQIIEEPPSVREEFSYTYNPFGKRDPFQAFIETDGNDKAAPANPILGYPLANFKLTGILWGLAAPKAIVEVAGKGFIIGRGARIGVNRGRVVSILKNQILVAEEYRDSLGKLVVKEYKMKLEDKDK